MNLYLIDVSAVVYTGDTSPFYGNRQYYGYPVGGIHFLMQRLSTPLLMHDDFILCFDSPSFRCKEEPSYKKGRAKNYRVISQIETIYTQLNSCGIPCMKVETYEADDLISWASAKLASSYYETIIVGNDHDLCHNVHDNIRFQSVIKDKNNVYPSNFSTSIEKGVLIPLNTISAYKALCGCKSDGVPAFRLESGLMGRKLYDYFIEFCEALGLLGVWHKTADPRVLEIWARNSGLFTTADQEHLKKRIRLIYPAPMPEGISFPVSNYQTINKKSFERFATLFNTSEIFKSGIYRRAELFDSDKDYLRTLANELNTGKFSADRSLQFDKPGVQISDLRLNSFTKDF